MKDALTKHLRRLLWLLRNEGSGTDGIHLDVKICHLQGFLSSSKLQKSLFSGTLPNKLCKSHG